MKTTPRLSQSNSARRDRRRAPIGLEALEERSLLSATASQVLLEQDYLVFLNRPADPGGLAAWTNALNNGATQSQISQRIAGSNEALTDDIDNNSLNYLGRTPSQSELNSAIGLLQRGYSPDRLKASVLSSSEFYTRAGGTNQTFVQALYTDVLGRTGESAGVVYWTNLLNSHARNANQVAYAFLTSPEAVTRDVTNGYESILGRAPDAGGLAFWSGLRSSEALFEQGFLADLINSPENLQRINGAIAANPNADDLTIAQGLLLNGQTSTAFSLSPATINFGTISSASLSTSGLVTEPILVTNLDPIHSLSFTPLLNPGPVSNPNVLNNQSFADAIIFLGVNGNPITNSTDNPVNGPVVLGPGQSTTIQAQLNPALLSTNGATLPLTNTVLISLLNGNLQPITDTATGVNNSVTATVTITA